MYTPDGDWPSDLGAVGLFLDCSGPEAGFYFIGMVRSKILKNSLSDKVVKIIMSIVNWDNPNSQ